MITLRRFAFAAATVGGLGAAIALAADIGAYTIAQADLGKSVYEQRCAGCHGADLEGGVAPNLRGPSFLAMATAQKLTAGSLLQVIQHTMPKDDPGSLSPDQNAAVVAFILRQNGYPAGPQPLTPASPQAAMKLDRVATPKTQPANDHGAAVKPPVLPETMQAAAVSADVDVSDAMLRDAGNNLDNWSLFGRTYDNQRFSPLKQVNDRNVGRLRPAAIIQTGISNSFEASPIVVNGVMYISTPYDHVQAYDATTGEPLWSYNPQLEYSNQCCGPVSRGVAVAYGKVFVAQLDGVVVALDARTGKIAWKTDRDKTLPPPDPTFYSFTLAPQVYDGMVIVGSAGGEYPTRGFVQAYDARTGRLVWHFNTIPGPGEPGHDTWAGDSWKYGGSSMWDTPAIDVKNDLVLFGTGNPNPDDAGDLREGANAYTNSIVAVHARTGKLAWWYQIVPHDMWDYDQCAPVILFDADDGTGHRVPAVGEAGKEGNLFIVNRLTGKLIRKSEPFVLQSSTMWTKPGPTPTVIYPSPAGGNTWSAAAFSPVTRAFYVPGANMAWSYASEDDVKPYTPGTPMAGQFIGGREHIISGIDKTVDTIPATGTFSAIDVDTGKIRWQYKSQFPMIGGAMATGGNLVFTGEQNGYFNAFNATTGKKLWRFNLGVGVTAPSITYRVKGVQYVAVAAGGVGANGYERLMQTNGRPVFGDVVAIFALTR